MQTSALEKLAERGMVIIQKKRDYWFVECVIKDEAGFLVDRLTEWGRKLENVIKELLEKIELTE